MKIIAKDLGKQFQNEWIFKNLDFEFHTNKIYAVTGPNGSGKSTLLQVLAGFIPPTEGEVTYKKGDVFISPEHHYQHITVATPYTELIEEFTADELIKFHFKFKKILPGLELNKILPSINLAESIHKPISNFSSGMKQRLKLGLAFFSNTPIILLDEPTSNLDSQGIEW